MGKQLFGNGTGGLPKNVAEDIVKLKIRYGKTILCTVLFAGDHTGELEPAAYQFPQVTDISRRDKGRPDHVTHEQVADPFGILAVGLVSLLWFRIFGMCKDDRKAGFFQDIKNRYPVFAGRFHTDFETMVFGKPVTQFPESFGKRRETSLLVLSPAVCVGNPDTGIDPGFVDIKPTAVFTKDFESQKITS